MNQKRYTCRKRWVGILLLTLLGWFACTCAPQRAIIVPLVKQQAPPSAKSAIPGLESVRKSQSEAELQAARVSDGIDSIKRGADEAQADTRNLITEVDRLRKQKTASENELLNVYNRLVEKDTKSGKLLQDFNAMDAAFRKQQEILQRSNLMLNDSILLVHAKNAEAARLLGMWEHAERVGAAATQTAAEAAALAGRESTRADRAQGRLKVWTWIAIGEGILLLVIAGLTYLRLRAAPLTSVFKR